MKPELSRIGIDFISVLGLPPVSYVELAADLGCPYIGIGLIPITENPHNYSFWSLRDDLNLRRDLKSSLRDNDVRLSIGEGFLAHHDRSVGRYAGDLDIMAELGVLQVNIASLDPDLGRAYDELAIFAEMAEARSLKTTLEFVPGLPISDLPGALNVIRHVGNSNFRLLFDVMHVFRSGSVVADIAGLDPSLIGHLQICDVPMISTGLDYAEEARHERLVPGQGELPLQEILHILPSDLLVGIEVPMRARAENGAGPRERLAECIEATLILINAAESHR
jgi:sugar phosphate isomerase/epimerase